MLCLLYAEAFFFLSKRVGVSCVLGPLRSREREKRAGAGRVWRKRGSSERHRALTQSHEQRVILSILPLFLILSSLFHRP